MHDAISLWVTLPCLFIAMCVICYLGQLLNRKLRQSGRMEDEARGLDGTVVSGIFGLMALLMAFAFSLAINRFEERRGDVVEEANAIGTMASRLALVSVDQRALLEKDLKEYVQLRAAWGLSSNLDTLEELTLEADAVSARFADHLFDYIDAAPKDSRTPLLVGAYNAMSDMAATRHGVRLAQMPGGVMFLLVLFLFGAAGILGFTMHARQARSMFGSALLMALLATAYCAIMDLDRPARGTFQVPQDEMLRIEKQLNPAPNI